MNRIFVNSERRLRNGWWPLIFLGFVAVTRFAYRPVTHGLKALGVAPGWLEPAPFVFITIATRACLRLRSETLADVGFQLDRRWLGQLAIGAGLGLLEMLVIAGLIWAIGGVHFEISHTTNLASLGYGLYVFLFVALFEEALFRGFAFQRLVDGLGAWPAQIALALLFALGHFDNPGMQGATRVWATIDLMLGAFLFGLTYLRTRSLALPVGWHLGWNWAQGALLGFGVSGFDQAGWLHPVFQNKPEWLTGGAFGPESSVFAVMVDLVALVLIWRWKGTAPRDRRGRRVAPDTGAPGSAKAETDAAGASHAHPRPL